jgi:hypothetical protein
MGGLGGTGGRWRRRRLGSVMVVLASFQHVIGMARQNSAKPDTSAFCERSSIIKSKSSTASYPPHTSSFTHYSIFIVCIEIKYLKPN